MQVLRIAALCLALAAAVYADKVVLKDGRTYEGIVLEATDTSVRIKTAKATLTFPRDQVASIEKAAGGAMQEREAKLGALDPAKPGGYLEAAYWITGKGKDAYDLPTLRRLCAAASKLDPAQAYDAQMLLGKKLEEANMKREAAAAFSRAQFAKAGDEESRNRLEGLRQGLFDDAKREMSELAVALDLVLDGQYEAALPKLQKAETLAMAEEAQAQIGMSIESLTRDVARRVKCMACDGVAVVTCPACKGEKLILCNACGGTGNKKGFTAGKEKDGIQDSVCRTCFGCGSALCVKCKAERDITIRFVTGGPITEKDVRVHAKCGHEADALKQEIDLITYASKARKVPVAAIKGEDPTVGGKTPCGTCQGIKYDPPKAPPPLDKLRTYREDVGNRINGQKPYEVVPKVTEAYDKAVLADNALKYRDGAWVK